MANADLLTQLYDGDMVLTPDAMRAVLSGGSGGRHRRAIDRSSQRWSTKIPYSLHNIDSRHCGRSERTSNGNDIVLQSSG